MEQASWSDAQSLSSDSHATLLQKLADFDALIGSLEDHILELNSEGIYTRIWTPATLPLSPEVLIDQSFCTQAPSAIREALKADFERVKAGGSSVSITFSLPKHLPGQWFETRFARIQDGQDPPRILQLIRNVSDKHRAEMTLQQNQTDLQTLIDNTDDYIWSVSPDYRYVIINQAYCQFIAKTFGQHIEPGDSALALLDRTTRNFSEMAYRQALGGTPFHCEWLAPNQRVYQLNVAPIREKRGCIRGATVFCRDITVQNQVYQQLLQAKEEAEHAAQAKQDFLSVMSHEIRTPLNAVIGFSHLLMQEQPRPDQVENLHALKFSAENLLQLINDILDFNRAESGRLELEEVDFDLPQLIKDICQSLQPQAHRKGIVLEGYWDPDLPPILRGDPTRLGQVLTNLISNAVKFTEQGYVHVQIEIIDLHPEQVTLEVAVRDTGIGIGEAQRQLIFEHFTQGHSSTTRKYGGTGLGLAISQRLVQLMGSTIQVESAPNEGSEFYFLLQLPISQRTQVTQPLLLAPEAHLRGMRVLLVEDNPINSLVCSRFLERWEVEIDVAEDGMEAIDLARKNAYHAVLMDLQMPLMDGYEATRRIKRIHPKLPILALTANVMPEIRRLARRAGMIDYISKPFDPDVLYRKLHRFLPAPR
jgi:signal transduction histidine kinase/CheY-like chemotaxis protein